MSELIDKQILYTGKKIRLEKHRLLNPSTGRPFDREVIVHPGAVVILPFLDARTIVMVRNRRHAVGQTLLELPAGTLEKNEPPMNCAGRELVEETGYLAQRLQPLGSFFASPGILSERMFAFAAYELQFQRQSLEDDEEIQTEILPMEEAIARIGAGEIIDGKTIAILLMYERFWTSPKTPAAQAG